MSKTDHSRYCYRCGKLHYPPDLRKYPFRKEINKKICYFCSWGCWNAYWKEQEEKKKKKCEES